MSYAESPFIDLTGNADTFDLRRHASNISYSWTEIQTLQYAPIGTAWQHHTDKGGIYSSYRLHSNFVIHGERLIKLPLNAAATHALA